MVLLGITVGYYSIYVAGNNDLQTFLSHKIQGLIILLAFGVRIDTSLKIKPFVTV